MRPSGVSEDSGTPAAEARRRPPPRTSLLSHPIGSHEGMPTKPPTLPPLTLFDASQFEFEADQTAKTPGRAQARGLHVGGLIAAGLARKVAANAEAAKARRRRARARLAKRRYLADTEGYERIEQTRRALHLVAD